MTISAIRAFLCAALLSGAGLQAGAQAKSSTVLLPRGSADGVSIDSKLLPPGAIFELDDEHKFVLHGGGASDLIIVPLGLNVKPPGREHSECGVYFVAGDSAARYVPLIGQGATDDMCGGVAAIGLTKDSGPRPRLIVIAEPYNVHGTEYRQAFVLTWDASTVSYAVDQRASSWLAGRANATTIGRARRVLAQRHEK